MKILPTGEIAAIETGDDGKLLIVFYADQSDLGNRQKAIGALEFDNWEKLSKFITLQYSLVCRLNAVMRSKVAGH